MSLDYYYAPMSSATPVHWALEELGVGYEAVEVDLNAGDQRRSSFLSINPNGKVPVIMHDGVSIFESAAIVMYLGETFGVDRGLFPPLGPARGEAMKWIVWCDASLGEAVSRYEHNASPRVSPEERNERARNAAERDIRNLLAVLEKAVTGAAFLVENKFSLADVHAASWIERLSFIGIDLGPYTAIRAWQERCFSRPARARAKAS
jgi:glutathione S-transferase